MRCQGVLPQCRLGAFPALTHAVHAQSCNGYRPFCQSLRCIGLLVGVAQKCVFKPDRVGAVTNVALIVRALPCITICLWIQGTTTASPMEIKMAPRSMARPSLTRLPRT